MREVKMTQEELEAVVGGLGGDGRTGGVRGISNEEAEAVVGGLGDDGRTGGVRG
jgi:hypothetical protein